MANFIFKKAKESFLKGEINLLSSSIKVLILNDTYTPNSETDQFVSNISASSIEERSTSLLNKTITNGTFDADDIEISSYSGNSFNSLVLYVDTGSDSTSRLIAYIDTSNGLPFFSVNTTVPITIAWSNDVNKIISL